jgi:hypothetical protein
MCVDLYRQGKWPDTPSGVKEKTFHDMVRIWARQEAARGTEGLQHRNQNREWTADEKYAYVAKVLAGESYKEIAIYLCFCIIAMCFRRDRYLCFHF